MELQATQQDLLDDYVGHFRLLIGDQRTGLAFDGIVKGIINAGSLVCQQIAMHSAVLSLVKDGAQGVIRLAKGESTKRSQLDAPSLIDKLCERGLTQLAEGEGAELWLILDPSDLRKPYAREMPNLMEVRDLDGDLVPGYRTLNVLGLMPGRRGMLSIRMVRAAGWRVTSNKPGSNSVPWPRLGWKWWGGGVARRRRNDRW